MVAIIRYFATSLWVTLATVLVISCLAIGITVTAFGLRVSGGTALFFIIWWTLLFAVLPFGIQSQAEAGEVVKGSEPGAPTVPALREKAIWTTLIAAVVLVAAARIMPLAGL